MTIKLKKKMSIVIWVLLTLAILYLAFVAGSFFAVLAASKGETEYWTKWQKSHVASLEKAYAEGTALKAEEADFCAFDLTAAASDPEVKLNDLRFLATHNSYKQGTTKATHVFYDYALPTILGKKFDYTFDTLTDQLNRGIRSFEIDLGKVKTDDGFTLRVYHNALTEPGSSMIDVELGLKELKMWSDYNPGHLPVTVLVECKGGAGGDYKSIDREALEYFDALLEDTFGEALLTPADVMEGFSDFGEVRAADAYPTLGEARGKFIFLMHEVDEMEIYASLDESMRSQKMFLALKEKRGQVVSPEYLDRSLFMICNAPQKKKCYALIDRMLSENFIVRTRLDEFAFIDDEQLKKGLESGAQILSTDYPPATVDRYGYTVKIHPDGKTLLLR